MNGHAKGCICQDCTIGREIGMDRALELLGLFVKEVLAQRNDHRSWTHSLRDATYAAERFLSEHAEHEGVKE